MTADHLVRFFEQRPFEPFVLVTAAGREFHVRHPENAQVGFAGLSAIYQHPSGQVEIIDAGLIESIRTIYAADPDSYDRGSQSESE